MPYLFRLAGAGRRPDDPHAAADQHGVQGNDDLSGVGDLRIPATGSGIATFTRHSTSAGPYSPPGRPSSSPSQVSFL